jgi:hypothetical protein
VGEASDAKMEDADILSLQRGVDTSAAYTQCVEAFGIASYYSIEYVKPVYRTVLKSLLYISVLCQGHITGVRSRSNIVLPEGMYHHVTNNSMPLQTQAQEKSNIDGFRQARGPGAFSQVPCKITLEVPSMYAGN